MKVFGDSTTESSEDNMLTTAAVTTKPLRNFLALRTRGKAVFNKDEVNLENPDGKVDEQEQELVEQVIQPCEFSVIECF